MGCKLTVHGKAAARPFILEARMRALVHTLLAGWLISGTVTPARGQGIGSQNADGPAAAAGVELPPGQPRPRIGLVLSGGGARGAAHVGVLKTLEGMHIPIDAIAGTSMGAVVGGLYASGMSAAQIE